MTDYKFNREDLRRRDRRAFRHTFELNTKCDFHLSASAKLNVIISSSKFTSPKLNLPTMTSATKPAALSRLQKPATATLTEVKTQWQKVAARLARRPVQITRNGNTIGVLLSEEAYTAWLESQMEEEVISPEDLAIINARMKEPGIPWEQVKADMKRDGLL